LLFLSLFRVKAQPMAEKGNQSLAYLEKWHLSGKSDQHPYGRFDTMLMQFLA
jgi:hypothetical protein